jgi:pimeloyl-ACP methyl ester carboxylesterase
MHVKNIILVSLTIILFPVSWGQAQITSPFHEDTVYIVRDGGQIYGSLITLQHEQKLPIALIISGSGPTDRNGNNPMMTNNSLKMLADSLAAAGIGSIRYDKRGVAASMAAGIVEIELRFEDYVKDAISWVQFLRKDSRFNKVIIIGHSEGSLIGMIAASQIQFDGFISVAGPGESADLVIKRQLKSQPQFVQDQLFPKIDSLKNGFTIDKVDPAYFALLRPSVQPYLISWFKYDPQVEIKKLHIPILIIQGETDIQVRTEDAELLKMAAPRAELTIINGMNHIFKSSSLDRQENIATYRDPDLPIMEELVKSITKFIIEGK